MFGTPDLVATAARIAIAAHHGQLDKGGRPYVTHPARVALAVARLGGSPEAQAAAWLHDVLEDTAVTADDLFEETTLPYAVIEAVVLLTRTPDVSPDDYYDAIRQNPTALLVKGGDIADNLSPRRLWYLSTETQVRLRAKYHCALDRLGIPGASAAFRTAL